MDLLINCGNPFKIVCISVIMLYTLNVLQFCQLYFNNAEKTLQKKKHKYKSNKICTISI